MPGIEAIVEQLDEKFPEIRFDAIKFTRNPDQYNQQQLISAGQRQVVDYLKSIIELEIARSENASVNV